MLHMVEVITNQGATLALPLQDISEGYIVEKIDGLDPVRANIVSSGLANMDGEQYQSSRREKRNPVLRVGLEPNYSTNSVRELRNRLYRFLMPKSEVMLRFHVEGEPTVQISGWVESFESELFTKEPSATISILCFDPDFYDPNQERIDGMSTGGTEDTEIDYAGSVDTGFVFTGSINGTIDGFSIINQVTGDISKSLDFATPLLDGDTVEISTVPGNKYANLTRGGTISPILYGVSPYSDWLRFSPGLNNFRVYSEGAGLLYTVEYTKKYGGL